MGERSQKVPKVQFYQWTRLQFHGAKTNLLLVFFLIAMMIMTSCTSPGHHTEDEVTFSFYEIAREQTLAERQEILRWWSPQIILGRVRYIKEKDIYEIKFPDMKLEGEEIWEIDMKSSKIWPVNGGALLSAIALFCGDRNDQRLDCQLWFAQLDALVQEMEK